MQWFQTFFQAPSGLSEMLSAEDQTPPIFGGGGGVQLNSFSDNSGVDANTGFGIPRVTEPQYMAAAAPDLVVNTPPIVVNTGTTTSGAPIVQVNTTQAAGGFLGAWYTVRNFFTTSIPGLFVSASTMVRGWVGLPTTVTTTDKVSGASSTSIASSSWLVWVFLAGAAAAVYFATKGKGSKGGKSILSKLGGKSSVKLH